jgi:hypothetical protein
LNKLLSFLVESKIVPDDVFPTFDSSFNDEILPDCILKVSIFEYDSLNYELFIMTLSGERIPAPDLSEGEVLPVTLKAPAVNG